MKTPLPQVHDLLEINGRLLAATLPAAPEWLTDCLGKSSHVIALRSRVAENEIPIGICGKQRNQRFSAVLPRRLVRRVLTPFRILRLAEGLTNPRLPALRSLFLLKERWAGLEWPWGPIGSVAFELATGSPRVNAHSDLDIVLHAAERLTTGDAQVLFASTLGLPARVDIRVETPFCGFSLAEFGWARSDAILLRTPEGPLLGSDPWDPDLSPMAASARLTGLPS